MTETERLLHEAESEAQERLQRNPTDHLPHTVMALIAELKRFHAMTVQAERLAALGKYTGASPWT